MALPSEEQKRKIIERINAYYRSGWGPDAVPTGIGEDGRELHGAEEIYQELIREIPLDEDVIVPDPSRVRRGRVLVLTPDGDGSYDALTLDRDNELLRQWIMPEGGIQVNPENLNVNAPERPEYMDRPDEPEELKQTVASMIPPDLRSYAESTWNDGIKAQDDFGNPLESTDAILDTLGREDPVFIPAENNLYRRVVYRDGHLWESAEPVEAGEYVSSDEMRRVAISPSPQQDYLKKNGFTNAHDLQGNVYTDQVAILEQLEKPGAKLYLYDNKHSVMAVVRNENGMIHGTSPKVTTETDPLFFERYPGLLPEDGNKILTFDKNEIESAVDENGRKYDTPEKVLTALYGADKHLRIYKTGESVPYDVVKKNNRFYIGKKLEEIKDEPFNSIGEIEPPEQDPVKSFLKREWTFEGHSTPEEQKYEEELKKAQGPAYVDTRRHFAFALDENGRMYRDLDAVSDYLRKNERKPLFIFDKDGELPFAVEYKDGRMLRSNDPVSSQNRMRSSDAYEPKKSLDVDDIIHRADYSKVSQAKDDVSDWKKLVKFYEQNIKAIEDVKKAGKPKAPTKPKKPSLGFFSSIGYGFVWLFTFGQGDTKAHREYREKLENYPNVLSYYDTKLVPEYNKKRKHGTSTRRTAKRNWPITTRALPMQIKSWTRSGTNTKPRRTSITHSSRTTTS